jgi:hypothetical protein
MTGPSVSATANPAAAISAITAQINAIAPGFLSTGTVGGGPTTPVYGANGPTTDQLAAMPSSWTADMQADSVAGLAQQANSLLGTASSLTGTNLAAAGATAGAAGVAGATGGGAAPAKAGKQGMPADCPMNHGAKGAKAGAKQVGKAGKHGHGKPHAKGKA